MIAGQIRWMSAAGAGKVRLVRIEFVRSGGVVAAPGMVVRGEVDLPESGGAQVTSPACAYRRELSPEECARLQHVDPAAVMRAAEAPPDADDGARDRYQYDVTFHFADGSRRTVTFHGGPGAAMAAGAPAFADVADWIRHEAERIWQHKLSERRRP
jgi:hypothetical protein